jgi:O-antigen ligase
LPTTKPDPQPGAGHNLAGPSRLKPFAILSLVLWVLLWGGYNTGIGLVLSPGFPATRMQLVHGIRAFFPLLAAWVALLVILARGGVKTHAVAGPLGLLGFFAAVGLISSGLLSRAPTRALYWAAMYESVVIVLVAVCSNSEALSTLSRLMALNWIIDIVILVGLLAAIPSFGGAALAPTKGSPLGVMAYNGAVGSHGAILGMASTRNTGFARYAGVAGLLGLTRLWQGRKWNRVVWMGVLAVALYCLVLAQARTETLSFLAGSLVILMLRKRRRVVLLGAGVLGVILLALVGFFQGIWSFGTRKGGFDPTLTGRTGQWMQGLAVVQHSLWVGYGFQADRYYLHGIQLENAVFHALIQTGVLGTLAYVAAYVLAWFLVIRLYISPHSSTLPDEIPGVLMFFTVMSVTESIAYYSADWLLLAPVLAYVQVFAWQQKALRAKRADARPAAFRYAHPAYAVGQRNVAGASNLRQT